MESGVCGLAPLQTHEKLEHELILLEIDTSTIVAILWALFLLANSETVD